MRPCRPNKAYLTLTRCEKHVFGKKFTCNIDLYTKYLRVVEDAYQTIIALIPAFVKSWVWFSIYYVSILTLSLLVLNQ